ncbi:MAG: UPF0489 family protein [Candidatus Peribacteria bacterium]|jgi:hypothetical protein|nr:UPF0489 family protein [Candidatus Peribacteria bacterium]
MQFAHPKQALRVAPLIKVASFSQLEKKLSIDKEHIAFAEKDENGELVFFHGLSSFFLFQLPDIPPCYLFDNHNHALYFWYQEYLRSHRVCKLIHIDQHSDMWENQHSLPVDCLEVDRSCEVFAFVQKCCNVGNFMQPVLNSGLISEVAQIRSTYALKHLQLPSEAYILDIDLDFLAPEMGTRLEKCLPKLKQLMARARCITIATSPYFLEQERAIEIVKELISKSNVRPVLQK